MVCSTFLEDIAARTEKLIGRAHAATVGLSEEALNGKPGPKEWSIAQIFEHVRIANEAYLPAMQRAAEQANFGRDVEVRHTLFGSLLIKASGPSGNAPAPKRLIPGEGPFERDVVERFAIDHGQVIELAQRCEGVDLTRVKVRNPFLPVIGMNLADCFEIVVGHGERHIAQIEALSRG
jgi:hypothetical protein